MAFVLINDVNFKSHVNVRGKKYIQFYIIPHKIQ